MFNLVKYVGKTFRGKLGPYIPHVHVVNTRPVPEERYDRLTIATCRSHRVLIINLAIIEYRTWRGFAVFHVSTIKRRAVGFRGKNVEIPDRGEREPPAR